MTVSLDRTADLQRVVDRLQFAREAGLTWLISRISDAGEPVGADTVNSWYRLPWALAGSGRRLEAGRVLSWIEREALTAEGDLVPGPAQTPWTVENAPYPLSIIAIGAWSMERYNTAKSIMANLRRFQNPNTGGAYIEHPDHRQVGRQDVLCTAQLGMAGLMTGNHDLADGAYEWFVRLLGAQAELPDALYISTADDGSLVTEFDAKKAFGHVIRFQEPRQAFFNPGIGAAFLARYYMATGEGNARELGRTLLSLTAGGTDQQYDASDTVHVGKYAWGSAAMLEVDPQQNHLDALLMMGDWLANCQEADGRWNPSAFLFPTPSEPDALWKTAEHIMIINFMLGALEAHDRPQLSPNAAGGLA